MPRSPERIRSRSLGHLGVEAPVVAEPERDPGLLGGRDGLFGVLPGQRERLLAEDVLARARGGDHLLGVQGVRCRQDDGVDRRVGEQRLVAVDQVETLRLGERVRLLGAGAGRGGREADQAALPLDGLDQRLAPPAQPDNPGVDHPSQPVRISEKARSAARHSASASPSSRRTVFVPRTSETVL